MLKISKDNYIGLLVFAVTFMVYISSPIITSFDSRWTIHTSLSILKEGNTNLNEYEEIIKRHEYYAIEIIDGEYFNFFPIGTAVLAVPFVAVADYIFPTLMSAFPSLENILKAKLAEHGNAVEKIELIHLYFAVELIIASFLCAAAAVIIFLIARSKLPLSTALLVVFIFSFCSSSWSTSSRALWQHGPSMLMLAITIYLIILEKKYEGIVKYAAIPLAIAFIVRPTNVVSIFFITTYIFLNYRHQSIKYVIVALPFAAAFFAYNITIYNSLLPSYFKLDRVFHIDTFIEALAGNLISPARGVLIYSPIVMLGVFWIIRNFSKLKLNSLSIFLLAILCCHWVLISTFPHWWGGYSYGPRLFSDMVPLFMYFIVLFLVDLTKFSSNSKWFIISGIVPLVVFSFYIHSKGAYSWPVHKWNEIPSNIDTNPERIWDWTDLQFLR